MAFKVIQLHLTGLIFKGVCGNAGHLEIGKTFAFGQGLFTLTQNGQNHMETFTLEAKGASQIT